MPPDLTILFITYNSADQLATALPSLGRAEPAGGVEVIIVDNASCDRDQLIDVCRAHGARLLALSRNVGIGAAANRGFRHARGRYVAVANPDLVFSTGAVSRLVRFMDGHPDAGVVAPQFVYGDGTFQPSAKRFPRLRYVLAGRRSPFARFAPGLVPSAEFLYAGIERNSEPAEVESVVGAFMVFRREAFEQAGAYDEAYFMYAEDTDICRRVRRKWKVFLLPGVRVTHLVGQTRRQFIGLTEFHRLRSHRRFFLADSSRLRAGVVSLLFSFYLALQQAARLVDLTEFEYSWARKA